MEQVDSVIIISDTEGDNEDETSVFIVEDSPEALDTSKDKSTEVIDEECGLAITYSKKGNVMPHARYDCVEQDFMRTENEVSGPSGSNLDFCEQCYCYICDKLASECQYWNLPSFCHCNAHNKSKYWKAHRDIALTGALSIFNFDLVDIDSELRHGGILLQKFCLELALEYNNYLMGIITSRSSLIPCICTCHNQFKIFCEMCQMNHVEIRLYSYTRVFNVVNKFLHQTEKEKPKTAAIMMIGVAKEILLHKQPPHLNVLSWEDPFLTSILRGQNITGQRQKKGRKETLWEDYPVVHARVERMEAREEYRELVRYLRVIKCNDTLKLRALQDKVPFYFCKYGDFNSAAQSFNLNSSLSCCLACRLTPYQYKVYLKILRTGTVPASCELSDDERWVHVEGGKLLKNCLLLKCSLRILFVNDVLYRDVHCWSRLIQIHCNYFSMEADVLQVPPAAFVKNTAVLAASVLEDLRIGIVGLPKPFSSVLHQESSLILVTMAVAQMLHKNISKMKIVLPLIVAYGKNFWALKLLFDGLSTKEEILHNFCAILSNNIFVHRSMVIDVVKCHDANYVSDLVTLFLSFKQTTVQSLSIPVLNVLVEEWHEFKTKEQLWIQSLHSFLQNKVVPAMEMVNTAQFVELRNKLNRIL
ncbi:uncharacterized protein LOC144604211 isoform X3 [Rhinoraja longicauda]